ncbi:MAG: nucleoside hydrolase [Acidobacteria bacterium]|nr:nucleoside hydrolase [Acidobacteriota bacterium]MDA1233849.1 nucleoside hydrolase [Acidobacteriota bacterium]
MSGNRFFLSHDGAIDELIALLLLARRPDVDLIGTSLTSADCLTEQAMEAQHRLLGLAGRPDIPASLSSARAVNPFPWKYRSDCGRFVQLDALGQAPPISPPYPDGEQHLVQALESVGNKGLTILATGPLTQLQLVLERRPQLESRIREIVWMGGAVDVPGNLEPETLPGVPVGERAEWNAFWDPFAVDWIFGNTSVPLTIVPLDVSDQALISAQFLDGLQEAAKHSTAARLARDAYQLVLDQPMYRLWDMTAVCFALHPEFFEEPRRVRLSVEAWGIEQGALSRDPAGRDVGLVQNFAAGGLDKMYAFVIDSLA